MPSFSYMNDDLSSVTVVVTFGFRQSFSQACDSVTAVFQLTSLLNSYIYIYHCKYTTSLF